MTRQTRESRIRTAIAILAEETNNGVVVFEDRSPVSGRDYMRFINYGIRESGAVAFLFEVLKRGETRKTAIAIDKEADEDEGETTEE
jgi:hypothetical protein